MAHIHEVYDTNARFVIDPIAKGLKSEATSKLTIAQYDHNSERITFECPRYIEGHDMSLCNVIKVNYINIDVITKAENKGVYDVSDMQIDPEDEEKIIFSWLISRNATQLKGPLYFSVSLCCVSDSVVEYTWNSCVYKAVSVSESINNDDSIIEEYPDVLAQYAARLFELEQNAGGADWNAAEGEPGHVLNRTHYENGTEMKTLFDQTITVANNSWQGSGIVNLVAGNTYIVVWDGTEYESVAFATVFNRANAIALGNPYLLGVGENNNQPFVFGWAYEYGMLASGSMTNGDHTIKITEEVKAYKKLDECYLPYSARSYVIKLLKSDTTSLVGSIEISRISYDEFADIIWNGGTVLLDVTDIYGGAVSYRAPALGVNYVDEAMSLSFMIYGGDLFIIAFTNGTWTPPTA